MRLSDFIYRQKQKWKYHTAVSSFEKKVAEINRNQQMIYLNTSTFEIKGCGLKFNRRHHSFIVDCIDLFLILLNGGKFTIERNDLFYKIDDITLTLTTAEEFFIVNEIFFEGCYCASANGEFNVLDIGMNVGFASLFFAKGNNIKKVYGFEPFKSTYQQALINFQNNELLKSKIECYSYGLGDSTETMEVNYSYNSKGQVGVYGTDLIKGAVNQSAKVNIELFSASDELKRIFGNHGGQRFMMKIDCEGAEYAILRSLAEHKLLDNIDIIFIEWHQKGPEELLNILLKNNFKAFHHQASGKKVGMIYAAR